jgi:hypothetical protein
LERLLLKQSLIIPAHTDTSEVVGPFVWREQREDLADGVPELIDRSRNHFAEERLSLAKAFSIGLESEEQGRR